MTRFIFWITVISVIVSCSNTNQSAQDNSLDTKAIHSAIQEIESYLDSLDRNRDIPADAVPNKATRDSAKIVWESFVQKFSESKYEEAYNTYKNNGADFKVHLTHSTPRYVFLSEVLHPLMQEYENPDSLDIKYLDELAFEYYMQVASIQFATEDNPYVPEVHHLTIIDYGRALNQAGRREEALNLTPELKDAVLFLTEDAMEANYAIAAYGAHLFYDSGENEAVIEILAGLKSNVLTWWEEDAAEDWAEEYYSYYIKEIDALINIMGHE